MQKYNCVISVSLYKLCTIYIYINLHIYRENFYNTYISGSFENEKTFPAFRPDMFLHHIGKSTFTHYYDFKIGY